MVEGKESGAEKEAQTDPPEKSADSKSSSELSDFHGLALVVGVATAAACLVAYGWAQHRTPSPLGAKGAEVYVKGQLASLTGILGTLLLTKKPKAPKTTFMLAAFALPAGALFPWIHQLWPGAIDEPGWILARDYLAPAMFGFGVAMLVKAADAAKSRSRASTKRAKTARK